MRSLVLVAAIIALIAERHEGLREASTRADRAVAQVVRLQAQIADLQSEVADLDDELDDMDDSDGPSPDEVLEGPVVKRAM